MTASNEHRTADLSTNDPTNRDVVVVRTRGTGTATWALGSLYEKLVSAGETGGQLGVSIVTQPPGMASPLHVHTREAEAWFILDGTMTYLAGGELVDLAAGDFIYLPRRRATRFPHHRVDARFVFWHWQFPGSCWICTTRSACRPRNGGFPTAACRPGISPAGTNSGRSTDCGSSGRR